MFAVHPDLFDKIVDDLLLISVDPAELRHGTG